MATSRTNIASSKLGQTCGLRRLAKIEKEKDAEVQMLRMNLINLTMIIRILSTRLDLTVDLVAQLSEKALLREQWCSLYFAPTY
jgi:hypothetical protein